MTGWHARGRPPSKRGYRQAQAIGVSRSKAVVLTDKMLFFQMSAGFARERKHSTVICRCCCANSRAAWWRSTSRLFTVRRCFSMILVDIRDVGAIVPSLWEARPGVEQTSKMKHHLLSAIERPFAEQGSRLQCPCHAPDEGRFVATRKFDRRPSATCQNSTRTSLVDPMRSVVRSRSLRRFLRYCGHPTAGLVGRASANTVNSAAEPYRLDVRRVPSHWI